MSLRSLARDSALYTIGNVAPRLGALLLLPIYVRFLSPAEYGAVALLTSLIGILLVIYHLGIDSALMRLHFDTEDRSRARLYFSVAAFAIVVSSLLTLVSALVLGPIFETLFAGTPFLPLGVVALLVAFASSMNFIPSVLFRASGQPWRFLAFNLGAFAVSSLVSVVLVVGFGMGALGVFAGQLVANLGVLALALLIVARLRSAELDRTLLGSAIRLGFPLLPHGLSAWILRLADRWLLALLLALPALEARAQIGVYAVGYQLGYAVTLLVTSFNSAWSPYFYRIGDRPEAPRFYADMTNVVLAAILTFAVVVSLTAPEIVAVVADPGYEAAADVLPIIAFASVLQGAYTMFVTVIFLRKRTGVMALVTFGSAALNVALNVALIPPLGIAGAAWATFGAYAAFAVATYVLGRTMYPIRLDWKRLSALAIAGAAVVLASRAIAPGASLPGFGLHVAVGLAFSAVAIVASLPFIQRLRSLSRQMPADADRPG